MKIKNRRCIAKQLFNLTLVAVLAFNSVTPANANLSNAIDNIATSMGGMSTKVNPQTFRTSTMSGFHSGSLDMRFPVKAISLVSVEKAKVSVGCNGVSMTFGGMAFISGDEIIEYLKAIAKGVPALIYGMTLKAIAAPLEASLNKLYATMERLSNALKNSCEASQALVGMMGDTELGGAVTSLGKKATDKIGETVSKPVDMLNTGIDKGEEWGKEQAKNLKGMLDGGTKGVDPDAEMKIKECMGLALQHNVVESLTPETVCEPGGSFAETYKQIQTMSKQLGISEDAMALGMLDKKGNTTWNALQAYGVAPGSKFTGKGKGIEGSAQGNRAFANLMLSMVGYELFDKERELIKAYPPTIDGSDVVTLFLCGKPKAVNAMAKSIGTKTANQQNSKERLASWCQVKMGGLAGKTLYSCPGEIFDLENGNCLDPETVKVEDFDHQFLGDNSSGGLVFHVSELIDSSVKKAATGDKAFDDNEMMLMVLAPLPIYEIYNIAAAFPSVAGQLLQDNALLLSYGITNSILNGMFESVTTSTSKHTNTVLTSVPAKIHSIMLEMQSEIATSYASDVEYIDFYKQRIDNIVATVKRINKNVLEGSMSLGLDGQSFVEGLSRMSGK